MSDLAERIAGAVERLYRRDPRKYAKIVVWPRTAAKRGYEPEHLAAALERLEEMEKQGTGPAVWWPYLSQMMKRMRAEKTRGDKYAKGNPNSFKAILRETLRRLEDL